LAACNTLSPLAPSPKLTPEAQRIQAEARAEFDRALAKRLETCQITATGKIGVDISATPGAGTELTGSVTCEPKPWSLAAPPAQ
jgi:hypothetical protein